MDQPPSEGTLLAESTTFEHKPLAHEGSPMRSQMARTETHSKGRESHSGSFPIRRFPQLLSGQPVGRQTLHSGNRGNFAA
jgi:hypothetical protein